MSNLTYKRMLFEYDIDIPRLTAMYQTPEIAQYLSISDNYFAYVTNTANVYFYKVYENNELIATTHLEKQEAILFMDILVFPEFQRKGFGTKIIKDIQNNMLGLDYERIEVTADERNTASIKLFENAGFVFVSKEDELINLVYEKRKGRCDVGAMMNNIRQAAIGDLARIAEIVIFNYRLNFYPIFKNDDYYFNELQVFKLADKFKTCVSSMWVYDDGAVKGFVQVENKEIKKLFVEPVLQGKSIGSALLDFAVKECDADHLWALEKNTRAIRFYERHGFRVTSDKKIEEDTTEYLVRLER